MSCQVETVNFEMFVQIKLNSNLRKGVIFRISMELHFFLVSRGLRNFYDFFQG